MKKQKKIAGKIEMKYWLFIAILLFNPFRIALGATTTFLQQFRCIVFAIAISNLVAEFLYFVYNTMGLDEETVKRDSQIMELKIETFYIILLLGFLLSSFWDKYNIISNPYMLIELAAIVTIASVIISGILDGIGFIVGSILKKLVHVFK